MPCSNSSENESYDLYRKTFHIVAFINQSSHIFSPLDITQDILHLKIKWKSKDR